MERGKHEVAGEGGLDCHLGRLQVADLADHDDVGILAHERADAARKIDADAGLHLHLVERGLDHLDRVLHRADVHFRPRQLLERGVEGGGLARAGRARYQDDAVGLTHHPVPLVLVLFRKTQLPIVLDQILGVEDPHDELLAERGRHGREPQFDLLAVRRDGLQPAVLRSAFLDHVHAAQHLDAARHRGHHGRRYLVDLVQMAVDPEAHVAGVAPRLEVDVAGALLECVVEEPVADMDDVLVVGVELAAAAQLDQLFEVGDVAERALVLLRGALDGASEVVELDDVALDVLRIRNDALDLEAQHLLQGVLPFAHVRLARCDGRLARVHAYGEDLEALGVGARHDLRHCREIDLERIDVQVGQAAFFREPLGQRLEIEELARGARILPFLVRDYHQGVVIAAGKPAVLQQLFGCILGDQFIRHQIRQHIREREALLRSAWLARLHGFHARHRGGFLD